MYNLLPAWDRLSQVQICRKQTSLRSSIIITGSMIAQRLPAGKDRAAESPQHFWKEPPVLIVEERGEKGAEGLLTKEDG